MSCKDGYTNSYVVRMWYVILINVIMNWWVCNDMFRYLLVLYANVYGKIVTYVVVCEFVFWVRRLLCWWLIGRVYYVNQTYWKVCTCCYGRQGFGERQQFARNMLSWSWRSIKLLLLHLVGFYITLPTLMMHGQTQIKHTDMFMI